MKLKLSVWFSCSMSHAWQRFTTDADNSVIHTAFKKYLYTWNFSQFGQVMSTNFAFLCWEF